MERTLQFWKEENEAVEERYQLCKDRIARMLEEETVPEEYREYFRGRAEFLCLLSEYEAKVQSGALAALSLEEMQQLQKRLFASMLPENYETSDANPAYLVKRYGRRYGKLFSYLSGALNNLIYEAAEGKRVVLVLYMELFIEIYNYFEEFCEFTYKDVRQAVYSFAFDNAEYFLEQTHVERYVTGYTFAKDIIMESDLNDLRYLYAYGEYITENELKIADYLNHMPKAEVRAMAETVTEGYLRGFQVMRVPLKEGQTVMLRYAIGFERMLRCVIELLAEKGLSVTAFRTDPYARSGRKPGYSATSLNAQYDYDHRNDLYFFADKAWNKRRLEAMRNVYEHYKDATNLYAGPLVQETFGFDAGTLVNKEEAIRPDKRQQKASVEFRRELGNLAEEYMPSDHTSFTIIAYPLPSIGEQFEEIFAETVKINNLDNATYQRLQQTLIDALDTAEYCHVRGRNGNKTDLKIMLYPLKDRTKETCFENCTADVNIPVGEVFTSPKLTGTNGVLHVSEVFLRNCRYKELELTFEDGMVKDYSCKNFEKEEENKRFLKETLLHEHETLPLGEFAIGTNTTAYCMGKKYGIMGLLPILIAEKTGPHFAIGDTCYSRSEDHAVYNPDGKEIVARENEVSRLRKTEPEKAYFNCHTDITIPYGELGEIAAYRADGSKLVLIRDGRFVLSGTEELNQALDKMEKESGC